MGEDAPDVHLLQSMAETQGIEQSHPAQGQAALEGTAVRNNRRLVATLRRALPKAQMRLDLPDDPEGMAYLDVDIAGHSFLVGFRDVGPIGVADLAVVGFWDGPDLTFEDADGVVAFILTRCLTQPSELDILPDMTGYS